MGFTVDDAKVDIASRVKPMVRACGGAVVSGGWIWQGGTMYGVLRFVVEQEPPAHARLGSAFPDAASQASRLLLSQPNATRLRTFYPEMSWAMSEGDDLSAHNHWLRCLHVFALHELDGPLVALHKERWFDCDRGHETKRNAGQPPRGIDYERARRGMPPWPNAAPDPKPARMVRVSVIENIAMASAIALPILLAKTQPTKEERQEAMRKRFAENPIKPSPEFLAHLEAVADTMAAHKAEDESHRLRVERLIYNAFSEAYDDDDNSENLSGEDEPDGRFERAEWFQTHFGISSDQLRQAHKRGKIQRREDGKGRGGQRYTYSVEDAQTYWPDMRDAN